MLLLADVGEYSFANAVLATNLYSFSAFAKLYSSTSAYNSILAGVQHTFIQKKIAPTLII